MNTEISEELGALSTVKNCGAALFEFALGLSSSGWFVKEHKRWILREPSEKPSFVTFTIQYARAQSIVVTLYGKPSNFDKSPRLTLESERSGYWSKFTISNPAQLAAAASYIERSHQLSVAKHGR